MKKIIPYFLPALLIIQCSVFPAGKTFAQAEQKENKTATTQNGRTTVPVGITPGRAKSLVGGVVALISIIIGGMALARSKKQIENGRNSAVVALLLGFVGIVLSIVHLSNSPGGFGTGGGRAGAIVALVLGLIGMSLAGRALTYYRRS